MGNPRKTYIYCPVVKAAILNVEPKLILLCDKTDYSIVDDFQEVSGPLPHNVCQVTNVQKGRAGILHTTLTCSVWKAVAEMH